ncbi:phosphate signaling complex protein PhoU [Clostridia bacterium]|nr:phosphate signaling complex protein PhoU [Clostridia bacterium]
MDTRQGYLQELERLQNEILSMGAMTKEAIIKATESLKTKNVSLAEEVRKADDQIDNKMQEIETACIRMIATQQPVATDLRKIEAGIKTVLDLERIADYAEDIAKITIKLQDEELIKPLTDIPKMAQIAQLMLDKALDAYVLGDSGKAEKIGEWDDQIDELYGAIGSELVNVIQQDPSTAKQALQLMLAAKFMERIGDHITNIAENAVYIATGKRVSIS